MYSRIRLKLLEHLLSKWSSSVSKEFRCPTRSFTGRLVADYLAIKNAYLEKNAVELLDIQPDHKVLEIGFGSGIGLRYAAEKIVDGGGLIFGIDRSHFMVERAQRYCALEIAENKTDVCVGLVTHMGYPDKFFDRVFHCDSYYFWYNILLAAAELKRVMKPGAVMIATLSFDQLKEMHRRGWMRSADYDPVDYMYALETAGFENVHLQYHGDQGNRFQAISCKRPEVDPGETLMSDEEEQLLEAITIEHLHETMKHTGVPMTLSMQRKILAKKLEENK